jgi:hypothetical protein
LQGETREGAAASAFLNIFQFFCFTSGHLSACFLSEWLRHTHFRRRPARRRNRPNALPKSPDEAVTAEIAS